MCSNSFFYYYDFIYCSLVKMYFCGYAWRSVFTSNNRWINISVFCWGVPTVDDSFKFLDFFNGSSFTLTFPWCTIRLTVSLIVFSTTIDFKYFSYTILLTCYFFLISSSSSSFSPSALLRSSISISVLFTGRCNNSIAPFMVSSSTITPPDLAESTLTLSMILSRNGSHSSDDKLYYYWCLDFLFP